MGLLVIPFPKPTGLITMEGDPSPSLGEPSLLNLVDHASRMFKTPHVALGAQDTTCATVDLAEESPAPPEMAGTARLEASMTVVGQTEKYRVPAKVLEVHRDTFFDGFRAGDSPATLDRANIALFHTTRTDMEFVPPTEHMDCPVKTSAVAECLISIGHHADEPPFTLGKAKKEVDRAFNGLVLSNYALSPPRVGIEIRGVPGGDEGGWVEGASDIQGTVALTEVETAYAVEVLGDVDSSSPLMSINPLELVVTAELNSIAEVRRFDNSLNVSN